MHPRPDYTRFNPILIVALVALAATLGMPQALAQSLSESNVKSFVESLEAAQPIMDKHEDFLDSLENEQEPDSIDFSTIFSSGLEDIKGHQMYNDMQRLVRRHGFSGVEQWADVGDQVFQAWFALEMDEQRPTIDREMQAALSEIENSPHLTAEQKDQMRAMMQTSSAMMDSTRAVPETNKRLVGPYREQLRTLFDGDDEDW